MDNLKIILTFTYPHEAHLVKTKLESEGIDVFIQDELTVQANNFLSNAIGGVKLLVWEQDYDRALRILIESGQIKEQKHKERETRIPVKLIIIIVIIWTLIVIFFAIFR